MPAGTFYWAAAVFGLAGDSVLTIRLAYALLGIAGVAFSFLAFRVMCDRTIATIAALLLALSAWHLHYSRIAFIPIGSPLMQMATLFFLFLAVRRNSRLLFGVAGACLAGGIYTYQAFIVFAVSLALVLAMIGALEYRGRLRLYTDHIAALLGVALLVGLPMASFAWHNPSLYTVRYKGDSVTKTEDYRQAGNVFEKGRVLAERERDYVRSLVRNPVRDEVDASGIFPLIDPITLALIIIGGTIALRRARRAQYAAVVAVILVIGVSPAFAVGGWYRRTLGLAPLLSLLAALPLAALWNEGWKRGALSRGLTCLAVVAVVAGVAGVNLARYFGSYDSSTYARSVLRADHVDAAEFMADQPASSYVLLYDHNNTFDYETRRFVAPNIAGESRTQKAGAPPSLVGDRRRDLVYVFVGTYADLLPQVERLYPGGTSHIERAGEKVAYAAYVLPRSVSTKGPEQRDALRQQDLATISSALDQYRAANGAFPDTIGVVQTLCALSLDAGCALKDVLDPIPEDPLSVETGARYFYYYRSDGQTFALYAQREGASLPQCAEHPAELSRFASLLCVHQP